MRLLLDTNIWLASWISRGLCADLVRLALARHDSGLAQVLVCPAVREEAFRLLRNKFGADRHQLAQAMAVFQYVTEIPDGRWTPPPGFPDPDDVPIVGAAVQADATALVTGDRALLKLQAIGGLAIIDPREAFLRLRRLR